MDNFIKKSAKIKIILAVFVTIVIFIIGLAFFARPTRSENEKRELTPFPTFTLESFLNGEYTAQISLWFSDTYPLREQMIFANSAIQSLYGIKDEQVIGGGDADEIPTGPADIEFNPTDDGKGDTFEGTYINGDTAYQLYFFNKQNSDSYVALINEFAAQVEGKAQVYDMIVPLHYQIALSEETVKKYNASDCGEAIKYMYGNLSGGIKSVDVLPNLLRHNDEYLYFRTDHHWTARGAYYAYLAFCKEKGIEPTPLDNYKRLQFDGFLGTFYANAKQPAVMKNNPDFVEAFVPIGTNREDVYDGNGKYVDWYAIVYSRADKYDAANKYLAFMGGDHPLTEIRNPKKPDGSSIVVIKESYGNAFVPFLVDSYEYVYVIDYRQWNGKLSDFVIEKGIDDVLFLNVVSNTSTSQRLKELSEIIK